MIELVIVVVILGIIGAIAVPRLSRGAAGAKESALVADLASLRRAIELYAAEHGAFPTDKTTIAAQLTQYSNLAGNTSPARDTTHFYGPYLRTIPALPVGDNRGSTAVQGGGNPGDGSEGWWYDKDTGRIVANTDNGEVDASGKPYNQY